MVFSFPQQLSELDQRLRDLTLDSPTLVILCVCVRELLVWFSFSYNSSVDRPNIETNHQFTFFSATFAVSRGDWVLEEAVGKKMKPVESAGTSQVTKAYEDIFYPGPRLAGYARPQPHLRIDRTWRRLKECRCALETVCFVVFSSQGLSFQYLAQRSSFVTCMPLPSVI